MAGTLTANRAISSVIPPWPFPASAQLSRVGASQTLYLHLETQFAVAIEGSLLTKERSASIMAGEGEDEWTCSTQSAWERQPMTRQESAALCIGFLLMGPSQA
jgi:hypothetical protein